MNENEKANQTEQQEVNVFKRDYGTYAVTITFDEEVDIGVANSVLDRIPRYKQLGYDYLVSGGTDSVTKTKFIVLYKRYVQSMGDDNLLVLTKRIDQGLIDDADQNLNGGLTAPNATNEGQDNILGKGCKYVGSL